MNATIVVLNGITIVLGIASIPLVYLWGRPVNPGSFRRPRPPAAGYDDDGRPLTLDQAVERWMAEHAERPDPRPVPPDPALRGGLPVHRGTPGHHRPVPSHRVVRSSGPANPVGYARSPYARPFWAGPAPVVGEAPHRPDPTESGQEWTR